MPKLIIFDLDETIIGWETPPVQVWRQVCGEILAAERHDIEAIIDQVSRTGNVYWSDPERHRLGRLDLPAARRSICRLAFTELGIGDMALADRLGDAYNHAREMVAELFPDAIETLIQLREKGIRLAMITNGASDIQRRKLNRFELEQFFDCIVVEGEFGAGKPDAAGFIHIMESLDATPADTWMVGDDLSRDIAPCRELGIFSIWVNGTGNTPPPDTPVKPDLIIKSIAELPGLVEQRV